MVVFKKNTVIIDKNETGTQVNTEFKFNRKNVSMVSVNLNLKVIIDFCLQWIYF